MDTTFDHCARLTVVSSPCRKLLGGLAAAFLAERIAMGRSEAVEWSWLVVGWKRGTLAAT
eukprot:4674972-Prymnesium_polylepis.1